MAAIKRRPEEWDRSIDEVLVHA